MSKRTMYGSAAGLVIIVVVVLIVRLSGESSGPPGPSTNIAGSGSASSLEDVGGGDIAERGTPSGSPSGTRLTAAAGQDEQDAASSDESDGIKAKSKKDRKKRRKG